MQICYILLQNSVIQTKAGLNVLQLERSFVLYCNMELTDIAKQIGTIFVDIILGNCENFKLRVKNIEQYTVYL